jgi:aldehyde dehydrogenase
MQVTDELIRGVVQEVLAHMRGRGASLTNGKPAGAAGQWGVFREVGPAVEAAQAAQREFAGRGLEDRKKAVDCVRRICIEQCEPLGREEFEETKIGRLEHKVEKLVAAGERVPGVEMLRTDAFSGGHGITLTEYAPFGVIGAITPVTHSLPTLACNAINMLAAGNAVVFNAHPAGARIARKGVQLFNKAIADAIGIENLLTIIEEPTLESAQAIFDHRGVTLLCVTGGPAVARAALRSPKRAVVAGPGNPPVVVDETADLDNAARSIVIGGAYDNNLLCIGEKQVFVVESVFGELMGSFPSHQAAVLTKAQVEALTKAAFMSEGGKLMLNKDLVGKDAAELAERAGFRVPRETMLLVGETDEDHPFVDHEQMMPFVPVVRVPGVNAAIDAAERSEHGFRHTSVIHSRNLDTITRMGRQMNTTLFIQNGPSVAGLGTGGEGFLSFSIATPTGEGVTSPLTFTKQRRSTTVGAMRVL